MTYPDLTIVVPSQGRATLPRLLESIRPEHHAGYQAEVFLVGDSHGGYLSDVPGIAAEFGCRFEEVDANCHAWGYPQIQHGYDRATGDYILCIGDDDVYLPGALNQIRAAIVEVGRRAPFLFKVRMRSGTIFWNEAGFLRGSISTQCFCFPNVTGKLGFWWDDFAFAEATVNLWGGPESIIWREELIAEWRA